MLSMRKYILTTIGVFLLAGGASAQFVVHNNGAEVTVNQGCIVTIVTGDLNNDQGTIDNAGRITVEGNLTNGDALTGGGGSTGIFNVTGDWVNNAAFTADQSLVNLNGANQMIAGTQISSFYNLNILGTGVKSLALDAEVSGVLQLNNLELATGVNTLSVLNGASTAVTESGGFVSSLGAGRLSWATNSTDTYIYPLGSNVGTTRIRPLAITPASNAANTFAARLANVDATTEGFDLAELSPNLCNLNENFYTLIDQVSGADAADITQYFVLADDGDWANGAYWDATPQWEDMGNETSGTAGVYNTVTNLGWSDFSNSAFILGNALPEVSIDAVSPLCESADPITLNASPAGGSFTGTGVSGSMFDPANAGGGPHTVTYTYADANGCSNTAEIEIEVEDAPAVTITSSNNGALELCDGESMELTASGGFVDYEWNTTETDQTITVTEGGQYSVTATDANGCVGTSAIANVTIQELPDPFITASGPTEFCEGESVILSTAANQGGYDWEITNGTDPTTVVTESGEYFVTVTNLFGCVGVSNSIIVDVTPMDDALISSNGNDLTVDPPGTGYQWFINGDPIPGATDITYEAIQSGNYHVEYVGPNGCPTAADVYEFTFQVGVDELGVFQSLDVYPNPGKGEFFVRGQLPTSENVEIEVTNMLGQALQPTIFINGAVEFTQPVDISQYANGVYFVRIKAADTSVTVRYIKS